MRTRQRSYIIMSSTEAIQRFDAAEGLAKKHYQAKTTANRNKYANELFNELHNDHSVIDGRLSPMSSFAHNVIQRRGRWDDPAQTSGDIAQNVAMKIFKRKIKWPPKLPFKILLARTLTCSALDEIRKNYRHYKRRMKDVGTPEGGAPEDILLSVVNHRVIPELAYEHVMTEVKALVSSMSPLERSVAEKRIMDIETLSGIEFADLYSHSEPWASGHYQTVLKKIHLYIFAIELGIGA